MPNTPIHQDHLALDIRDTNLFYQNYHVLKNINLQLKNGSLCALIGPNGAGKSSLVKAICNRIPLKSGSIKISGKNTQLSGARRALGVAPQRPALYDHLTAEENLLCFARQAGLTKAQARQRVKPVLLLIDMYDEAKTYAGKMSGGMRQRVNIGAAIMHEPQTLILDEPTANLDPEGTIHINEMIKSLKKHGFGILLITHDMEQATMLADTVHILNRGKIELSGAPQDIVEQVCGNALRLILSGANQEIVQKYSFEPHPENIALWSKTISTQEEITKEIQTLLDEGFPFTNFSVHKPDLKEAFELITHKSAQNKIASPSHERTPSCA